MTTLEKFGQYLKKARERKGMSLRAVEAVTDISNAYLSQIEQGKIKQPSPVMLHQLSQLYKISYTEVMSLAGYPIFEKTEDDKSDFSSRIGPVTEEEQEELLDYLKYLRSRQKGEN